MYLSATMISQFLGRAELEQYYDDRHRTLHWQLRIILHFFRAAVINAKILYESKFPHKRTTLVKFMRHIVREWTQGSDVPDPGSQEGSDDSDSELQPMREDVIKTRQDHGGESISLKEITSVVFIFQSIVIQSPRKGPAERKDRIIEEIAKFVRKNVVFFVIIAESMYVFPKMALPSRVLAFTDFIMKKTLSKIYKSCNRFVCSCRHTNKNLMLTL